MAEYGLGLGDYWFWGLLGFLIASVPAIRNLSESGTGFPVSIVLIVTALYAGALGARILSVLIMNPGLLISHPLLSLAFWQGGLSWQGGFTAAFPVIIITALVFGRPALDTAGALAPSLALAHAVGRVGCLFSGCCHGTPTSVFWSVHSGKLGQNVHPTQAYSGISELILFIILQRLFVKRPDSRKYLYILYALLFSIHRFFWGFLRGDPPGPELIPGLRIYQVICLIIFLMAGGLFLAIRRARRLYPLFSLPVLLIPAVFHFNSPGTEPAGSSPPRGSIPYLVITREVFKDNLSEWITFRENQGYLVIMKSWAATPAPGMIKDWIRYQCKALDRDCRYILLVGDSAADKKSSKDWSIPPFRRRPSAGESDAYPADWSYGDLDENGLPEVAVGRLPVKNVKQLKTQIEKIKRFDQQPARSSWNRVIIWSGDGRFQAAVQDITAKLAARLPAFLSPIIIRDQTARYDRQPGIFLEEMCRPAFISIISAHGAYDHAVTGIHNKNPIGITVDDVDRLNSFQPTGPLVIAACDTGRFDLAESEGNSLGEAFLLHPGGPVNIVSASGKVHALANYIFIREIISRLHAQPRTIGDLFFTARESLSGKGELSLLAAAGNDRAARQLITALPGKTGDRLHIPGLLVPNLEKYNLLGDPANRLRYGPSSAN